MPTLKLTLEYDGSHFNGWQVQPGLPTVQGALQDAVATILRLDRVSVIASGRTDTGVHALGQIAHLRIDKPVDISRLRLGLCALLKGRVAVLDIEEVSNSFHALGSAKRKHYSYRILNRSSPPALEAGRVWHVHRPLNRDLMQEAAQEVCGTKDFTSVRASGCGAPTPVRTVYESYFEIDGAHLTYHVVGNGFLYNMVRILVGTLVEIGQLRVQQSMTDILAACNRQQAGRTAPAHGLYLHSVEYP